MHSCMSFKECSRTKVFNVEQDTISISMFSFMTLSLFKYLLCEGTLFLIRHFFFLFPKHFCYGDSTQSGTKRRNAGFLWAIIHTWRRISRHMAQVSSWRAKKMPNWKDICCISQNKLKLVFTTDTTKCANVSLKPRVRRKTVEKWQASWWEFVAVTLLPPLEREKKKRHLEPT